MENNIRLSSCCLHARLFEERWRVLKTWIMNNGSKKIKSRSRDEIKNILVFAAMKKSIVTDKTMSYNIQALTAKNRVGRGMPGHCRLS